MLRLLDEVCALEELVAQSAAMMSAGDQLCADNTKYVESPHSYPPNTLDEKLVMVPGATHLCISFDPRCHTERGRDVLDIIQPATMRPLCPCLHGQSRW